LFFFSLLFFWLRCYV